MLTPSSFFILLKNKYYTITMQINSTVPSKAGKDTRSFGPLLMATKSAMTKDVSIQTIYLNESKIRKVNQNTSMFRII